MTGTGKLFFRDKEIEGVESFSLLGFPIKEVGEINTPEWLEKITFHGTYDPIDEVEEGFKKLSADGKDIITANIYNYDGEMREAKVKLSYKDSEICCEPIEEEIREWVKGWMK